MLHDHQGQARMAERLAAVEFVNEHKPGLRSLLTGSLGGPTTVLRRF